MARISRIVAVGYPHHITQRGVRSMDIFKSDSDRTTYLQFIREETQRCEIDILAWCLMTNHVHFIVVPHTDTSLARGFGEAHKRYTRMKNFRDNSVPLAAIEKLPPEKVEGKIIRGVLRKEVRAEFTEAYAKLCVKAQSLGGGNE